MQIAATEIRPLNKTVSTATAKKHEQRQENEADWEFHPEKTEQVKH